jgi:tetratricopeptide (TPR) repeat protein
MLIRRGASAEAAMAPPPNALLATDFFAQRRGRMGAIAPESPITIEAERWWRRGDLRKAEACYRQAVAQKADDATAIVGLARAALVGGNRDEARDLLARVGTRADALIARGALAEAEGEQARALTLYQEAASLYPRAADAHFNAGRLLAKEGKFAEAEAAIARALAIAPRAVYELHMAGVIGRDPRRVGDAILRLGRAIALDRKLIDAYCLLADVMVDLGRLEGAEEVLRLAEREMPSVSPVRDRLAKIEARRAASRTLRAAQFGRGGQS